MNNFTLGSNRNPIKLIGINAPFQPKLQLGHEYSGDCDRRNSLLQESAVAPMSQRFSSGGAVQEPAPQRDQTIWSHQLSQQLRRTLRNGFSQTSNIGRNHQFPQITDINIGNSINSSSYRVNTNVASVPNIFGQMTLRAV